MAIQFVCDNCQKLLSVGDDLIGKEVQCPFCKTVRQTPQAVPTPTSSQTVAQGVQEGYPAARLDYEGGLGNASIFLVEIILVASGLGIWTGSAWVFGGALLGMFVSLFVFRKLAMVLGIVFGVLGGVLGGVVVYHMWEGSLSSGIVGGILIGLVLTGVNVSAIQFTRQTT